MKYKNIGPDTGDKISRETLQQISKGEYQGNAEHLQQIVERHRKPAGHIKVQLDLSPEIQQMEELKSFLNEHPEISVLFNKIFDIKVRPSQADEVTRKLFCLIEEAGLSGVVPCRIMCSSRLDVAREIKLAYKGHTERSSFRRYFVKWLAGVIAINGPTSLRAKQPQMRSRADRISAMCRECGSCLEDGLRSHAACFQQVSAPKQKGILHKLISILQEVKLVR